MLVRKSRIDAHTMAGIGRTLDDLKKLIERTQDEPDESEKKLAALEARLAAMEGADPAASLQSSMSDLRGEIDAMKAKMEEPEDDDDMSGVLECLGKVEEALTALRRPRHFRFEIKRGSDGRMTDVDAYEVESVDDSDRLETIRQEIAAIEGRMRSDMGGYRKDAGQQARYRELLAKRDRAVV